MDIIHAFSGSCVESEHLKEFGNVFGFGIEETFYSKTNTVEFIVCDLRNGLPVQPWVSFDIGLFQPPCKKYSLANGNAYTDYENLIPVAKGLANKWCDYWVIENVRNSPIGFDPDLRLKGDMFGLPLKYERVFWSNFDIPQPSINEINGYPHNIESLNKQQAKEIKEYDGRYYAHDIIKNSLPKPYVQYIFDYCPAINP